MRFAAIPASCGGDWGRQTNGGLGFYVWMIVLTAIALVGANAWAHQVAQGMIVTNMTDHVLGALYRQLHVRSRTCGRGVMMVIPAYLYDDEDMHKVVNRRSRCHRCHRHVYAQRSG